MSEMLTDATADAPKPEPVFPGEFPKGRPPQIDPLCCVLAETKWRTLHITLPKGVAQLDVVESRELWKGLQESRYRVNLGDVVRLVAWDRSWLIEGIVTDDLLLPVKLKITVKTDLAPPESSGDARHSVDWHGTGWALTRRADGMRASNIFATRDEAMQALRNKNSRPWVG